MAKVITVDKNDREIGAEERDIAVKKGLIRRVVRVFIFNKKGELFLQRRSKDKDIFPDTWDNSAGGHVDEGETWAEAAKRELFEELGVRGLKFNKISKIYIEKKLANVVYRQFSTTFTARYEGEFKFNEEVSRGKWFSVKEIEENIKKNPEEFAYGFTVAFRDYFKDK